MKSLEKSGTPIETIIFPKYKIKPYNEIDSAVNLQQSYIIMESSNCQKNLDRKQTGFHLLEVTEPHLILQKIFHPYLVLVKMMGCQPLKIENGCAKFKWLSWNVAFTVLMFGLFLFDTCYFLPIMKHMNSAQKVNFMIYVTEIILLTSQIFAAQMSYIFLAVKAKQIANFWNRLQAVVVKLLARCPNHLDLVPSYRSARMKIVFWLMFTIVFGACYMYSFQDDILTYLRNQNYNPIYSWFMFFGFACYSVMLSVHILHSTCFTTFICVLCSSFQTLGNIAMKQDGQGNMINSQSPRLFQEITEMYEELLELKNLLGGIYGIHLALEILAMIICSTINCYFLISQINNYSLVCLNAAIAIPYLLWFHKLCESGAGLHVSMQLCFKNFRKAITNAGKKAHVDISGLVPLQQIDPPDCLSCSGYFTINMRLFTTVISTIATYLVVMLQFGAGINNDGGGLQSLVHIGSQTRNSTN